MANGKSSAQSKILKPRLAAHLKAWRARHKQPLKAVAAELDVSVTTLWQWENAVNFPPPEKLELLAELMGIPCCRLFCSAKKECIAIVTQFSD
jgi:transcriptional regulator with XRE-family HTH domain